MKTWILKSILAVLLLADVAQASVTYDIRAYMDGRDQLVINSQSFQWHHFDYAAVGRWSGANYPTTITINVGSTTVVNAQAWIPSWPENPPAEIRYNAWSSTFATPSVTWPTMPMVECQVLASRGPVAVVQAPNVGNGNTLAVEFNDNNYGTSPSDYTFWYHAIIRVYQLIPGDVNKDEIVDDNDLGTLLGNWSTGSAWAQGDFNEDRTVDDNDLGILLGNWTGSGSGVPEPVTLSLLALGALAMIRRRLPNS